MATEPNERRTLAITLAVFVAILAIVVADLSTDYQQGVTSLHVVGEAVVLGLGLVGAGVVVRRWLRRRREASRLREQLEISRNDADRWRREAREALEGLGEAIDRQFDRWDLTPAEREVALLLLKGFSHREIAGYRDVGEQTVRQQAHAVYSKADVSGRAQLSAFFLEDLLLPSLREDAPNET